MKFLNQIFTNIWYEDRKYFLLPSNELHLHPLVLTSPPQSLCLKKRLERLKPLIYANTPINAATTTPPPVFIIPYTPMSEAVNTRQLLLQHWERLNAHSDKPLQLPIIAYQSCPSQINRLVFQKAAGHERDRNKGKPPLPHGAEVTQPVAPSAITNYFPAIRQ